MTLGTFSKRGKLNKTRTQRRNGRGLEWSFPFFSVKNEQKIEKKGVLMNLAM